MKRTAAVILSVLLFLNVFIMAASAETDFEYGFYNDGTVYISAYNGNAADLEIPHTVDGYTVSGIGRLAFAENQDLVSVALPDSLEIIDTAAFFNCTSLKSINIPQSAYYIAPAAFYGCDSLEEITVSEGNVSYTSVDGVLFTKNMSSLTAFPGGRTGEYTIPEQVGGIEYFAFGGCKINAINASINSSVFTSENGVLFNKDKSVLLAFPAGSRGEYSVPDGVFGIENGAFSGCDGFTSVTLPNSLKLIGEYAFAECGLTHIELPRSVAEVGQGAFIRCKDLISAEILNSVRAVGKSAFSECGEALVIRTVRDCAADRYARQNGIPVEYIEPVRELGDVNGDFNVNATDATLILQYFASIITDGASGFDLAYADLDSNAAINSTDATLALQLFAGIITWVKA